MMGIPLGFGAPLILFGLIALPIIWYLLRLTPPKPSEEIFPPLKILARLLKREETPQKSPWWLTLLRLTMAGLVVLALAEPILNPQNSKLTGTGPLAIIVDNSWGSAPIHADQLRTATNLINLAEENSRPVILAATASEENSPIGPFDAATARERLAAIQSEPVPGTVLDISTKVASLATRNNLNEIAWLSAGLESKDERLAFDVLIKSGIKSLLWYGPSEVKSLAITAIESSAEALKVNVKRTAGSVVGSDKKVFAYDEKGRLLGEASISFTTNSIATITELRLPLELRNDIASVSISDDRHAGATRLLDDKMKRKRVALLSGATADSSQPLLSPLYYIERALSPYADIIQPRSAELSGAITELVGDRPSVIVMADVGAIPEAAQIALSAWIEKGGMLVRFAGPRLAASSDENLLPVGLRRGERALDGAMSWTVPQSLLPFSDKSPFVGIDISSDLSVSRQVLAEPSPDLAERAWADLSDGTPLVTALKKGRGTIVLFHVTPTTSWSNLPLTGTFVEMLRRTVSFAQSGTASAVAGGTAILPPLRMISADGMVSAPPPTAKPITLTTNPVVTFSNPPGLYGTPDGAVAVNLLKAEDKLILAKAPDLAIPVTKAVYQSDDPQSLKGMALLAALALLALDCVAVLWMTGAFAGRRLGTASLFALAILMFPPHDPAFAQENPTNQVSDAIAIEAISKTRLAYVKTGNASLDKTSHDGLFGLTIYLRDKTALDPADPVAVDMDADELVFFPMIYWPIDADTAMPSAAAIARADAYMRQGGTILFDTRDEDVASFEPSDGGSPANQRLRDILSNMSVPPLEPVPTDHVLTKSFYLLNDFPGRYSGGSLWVEASTAPDENSERPVRTGDGVSPILITSNDFASAWAMDDGGNFQFSTVPSNDVQREHAFRTGINIVIYMLTGNYKSDQVHIPALLERLGQ